MNGAAWALTAMTLAFAVGNWWAVAGTVERKGVEYVCKPATLVALILVALVLDPTDSTVRAWFVAALVLSLAGDVFLMLPRDLFLPGLVSFLLGHLCFVVGLVIAHDWWAGTGIGLLLVAVAVALLAPMLLPGVRRTDRSLVVPVVVYMAVISAMVVGAWGTGLLLAIGGALSFYASDATLAWNRFVEERPHGHVAVMVTYHLGQLGLALSLVQHR